MKESIEKLSSLFVPPVKSGGREIIIMRKIIAIALGLTLMACGAKGDSTQNTTQNNTQAQETQSTTASENVTEEEAKEVMVGGWKVNEDLSIENNKAAMDAFNKAMEDLDGYRYEVISVLGSQTVSGTNYSYLCKGEMVIPDAKPEYIIVNVYEDLEGKAEITGMKALVEDPEEGFAYNEGSILLSDNAAVEDTLNKAMEGLVGVSYDALAYIGESDSQYAVFAMATPAVLDPQKGFCMIYLNKEDQSIVDIKDVDIDVMNMETN